MKYVLLLSLFYKHYKKSSTLKLFLDDQLIDEIILDKNIDPIPNRKTLNQSGICKPNSLSRNAKGIAPPQEQKPKKARG